MSVFDGTFVEAVNANGEKQTIPADWIGHPVLGAGFRLPPSTGEKPKTSRGNKPAGDETPAGA